MNSSKVVLNRRQTLGGLVAVLLSGVVPVAGAVPAGAATQAKPNPAPPATAATDAIVGVL